MQGGLANIMNMGNNLLDKILPPATREDMKAKLIKFATEKPYLASFLLSQVALSGLPLALFIIMTISVALFALIAGLLVGLLGAALFIVGAIGVALLFLLPTLFFTTFAAVAVWLWGMGAYQIIKAFNQKKVPGIHVPMSDELKKSTGLDNLNPSLNNQQQAEKPQANGTSEKPKKKKPVNGHSKSQDQASLDQVTSQVPGKPVQQVDKVLPGVTKVL